MYCFATMFYRSDSICCGGVVGTLSFKAVTNTSQTKLKVVEMTYETYCKSRYGDTRYIVRVNEDTIQIFGKSEFIRAGCDPATGILNMFDFEGGPCFFAGEKMFDSDDRKHDFTNMVIREMREIPKDETSKDYMKDMCGVEIQLQRVKAKSKA